MGNYVQGWDKFAEWYGYYPDCHDAEIQSILLVTDPSRCIINLKVMNSENESAALAIVLLDPTVLNFRSWEFQNVILEIYFQSEVQGLSLVIQGSVGLSGEVHAASASCHLSVTE